LEVFLDREARHQASTWFWKTSVLYLLINVHVVAIDVVVAAANNSGDNDVVVDEEI